MITDAAFAGPMDKQMKHHHEYADIYGFRYGYRGRNSSDLVPEWMGKYYILFIFNCDNINAHVPGRM